jgi:hypothetical protein
MGLPGHASPQSRGLKTALTFVRTIGLASARLSDESLSQERVSRRLIFSKQTAYDLTNQSGRGISSIQIGRM